MKLKEVHIRWLGIPVVGLIAMVMTPKSHYEEHFSWFEAFLHAVTFTAVYWNGAAYIFFYFRSRFPDISKTVKRVSLTVICLTFWVFLGGIPVKMLFGYAQWSDLWVVETYTQWGFFNVLMTVMIGGIYEAVYFFEKWRESIKLTEELKNQQIRTQFAVLQNQMSPHFLFNSLNTLTTLIAENQEMAIEFTQKLSGVYRYILSTKDKDLVDLSEELDFARSYVFLLKMRFPENLQVEFDIPEKFQRTHIAPLTIQMLIENAIKHNEVSRSKPLNVSVFMDGNQSIVVQNNLQVKNTIGQSTKTGLANIKKRYSYLANREIEISTADNLYKVFIPVINLIHEKEIAY